MPSGIKGELSFQREELSEMDSKNLSKKPSWKNEAGRHDLGFFQLALPVFVMCACPLLSLSFWFASKNLDGCLSAVVPWFRAPGSSPSGVWRLLPGLEDALAQGKMLACYVIFQILCQLLLPSKHFQGPKTPAGVSVSYAVNGTWCYLASIVTYVIICQTGVYDYGRSYREFGGLVILLNVVSLLFCVFLYIKGRVWVSGPDVDRSNNLAVDFYWGTELHPRIFGFDIKTFIVTRMGMIGWCLLNIDFAAEQYRLYGEVSLSMFVCVFLQAAYILKFFIWETGYFCTMDIQHDRAGFYIVWGCLVWLPIVYTSTAFFLTNHPLPLSPLAGLALIVFGLVLIYINYDADQQRVVFRASAGRTKIWGREPEMIRAEYHTDDGAKHTSLLLVSGYWGLARHFHYLPEVLASMCWSLPAGFQHVLPWMYVIFLSSMLVHRAHRDEIRCKNKYGKCWDEYCRRVSFYVIPGLI